MIAMGMIPILPKALSLRTTEVLEAVNATLERMLSDLQAAQARLVESEKGALRQIHNRHCP
jgi:hypothetical protein